VDEASSFSYDDRGNSRQKRTITAADSIKRLGEYFCTILGDEVLWLLVKDAAI
jgi:hypothetical protein